MASSINSILGMGAGALYAHQNSIQTTGNNIANVDTEGYSRQGVRYETNPSLNAYPGQIGQGVRAVEVYRMFNQFVEKAYISKASDASRWSEQFGLLYNVDALVYESNDMPGLGATLNKMFKGWQTLSNNGTLISSREALLSDAETLATYIREQSASLTYMQNQMDGLISTDVNRANQLMQDIANLNNQINQHSAPGQNNPNALLDQRDLKVRQLAEIIDIEITDRGEGHYTVTTKSGLTLVEEGTHYELEFYGPKVNDYRSRSPQSTYTGEVHFEGADQHEYTIEVVKGGTVGDYSATPPVPGSAQFKVSLDSGATWLCDDGVYRTDAQVASLTKGMSDAEIADSGFGFKLYDANDESKPAYVGDIKVWFDSGAGKLCAKGDPNVDPNGPAYAQGDKFEIMPKSGIYWKRPTGEERINITPMRMNDGTENIRRITGGTLAAYFEFRDSLLGDYKDRLDTFASTLSWEVNRIHSQGIGLEKLNSVLGDYKARNTSAALGSDYSGLAFGDKLQAGTFSIALYNSDGEPVMDSNNQQMVVKIEFDPTATGTLNSSSPTPPGWPARTGEWEAGSMEELAYQITNQAKAQVDAAITAKELPAGAQINATITDGRLEISSLDSQFGFSNDTTGVLAGLGINTFFKGEGAADFGVRADIVKNLNLINAAAINGGGEGNSGDTITALRLSQLATKKLSITNPSTGKTTNQTLLEYYSTYVTKVGADTQTAKYNSSLYGAMAADLKNQQDSNSGVNLDEEMTNLVRFQNSYKAAAKLITTADEMLQTILGLKQ